MKRSLLLFPLALAVLVSCNDAPKTETASTTTTDSTTVTAAPPEKTEAAPPPMDSAAAAKAYMEYATPGEVHKMLAASAGKWTTETTMWMDEKAPPVKSTGTMESKMILGGRYMESWHKGNMMGMPFEGMGTTGYDNAKKVYVSTWHDNMGTGIMYMEGTYDDATKTMTSKGTCMDPVRGKTEMRETIKFIDDKTQMMEMYSAVAGGKETKMMEMKMTKK